DTLNLVDYIACEDTRNSINLLRYLGINKKLVAYHKFNEKGKSNTIIEDLKSGKNIGLISDAGCPCISDPGCILVSEAIENNIEVISIPGPSAVITSLMSCGMDTSSFTFYGFFPRENKEIINLCKRIKTDYSTLGIIYESPKRIMKTLDSLRDNIGDIKVCLANDLTKKFEKKYYGTITEVIKELKNNPNYEKGEYVLIIQSIKEEVSNIKVSIEALIVDEIINNNCSIKEAIKFVCDKYNIPKNEVYNASLKLKNIFH
ncbi:MAG: 16S rRNA (cytidine(1402)-2'-O)-methyltransferase, partial [Bacilli bacterium]|nr:16S rRNA (cytidine(1402)-2'-O)-methyltransferase [Bacilli bacterium]